MSTRASESIDRLPADPGWRAGFYAAGSPTQNPIMMSSPNNAAISSDAPARSQGAPVCEDMGSSPRLLDLINGDPDQIDAFFERMFAD